MGLLDAVSAIVADAGPDRDAGAEPRSEGSFWCDDCGERIRDVDYEGTGVPSCPSCGQPMTFDRTPEGPGCAC